MTRRILHLLSFLLLTAILLEDAVILFNGMNSDIEVSCELEGKANDSKEEKKSEENPEPSLPGRQSNSLHILLVLTDLHSKRCKHPEMNNPYPSAPCLSVLTQPPERA